jgi:hypothetical protein
MKRILLVLSLIGLIFITFMFSCDKSDQTDPRNKTDEATSDNTVQKEYVDPGAGGANCYCPNLANCKTDCLFSRCCICWDATKSEGSCGCYFGIAKCKTAPIGKDNAENNGGKHDKHEVNIYPSRFREFFVFLEGEKIKSEKLVTGFELLASASIKSERAEEAKVNSDQYNAFVDEFEHYLNSLDAKERAKVLEYIDKRTKDK